LPDAVTTANAGGANAIKQTDLAPLRARNVILWRDSDEAGAKWQEWMIDALRDVGVASIRVIDISKLPADMIDRVPEAKRGKFDVVDLIEAGVAPEAIRAAAEAVCEAVAASAAETTRTPVGGSLVDVEIDAEIERLSKLTSVAYERQRGMAARRLGTRATVLDRLVKGKRQPEAANGQGQPLDLPTPESWPDPVDGASLLSEMTAAIRKYVVMEAGSAEAVALWTLHAHALDAFQISPRLGITSPEKRCGKSTVLDVVQFLTPRPLSTSNTSAAAIFRTIEAAQPTLLIDEADTFLASNEEIRGVLNSGHRRSGAFVLRLVGDNHEPRQFSTWAAVAIALIGKLPDTLQDRAILIRMRRRLPSEAITPFRADRTDDLNILARKAARWAIDNLETLRAMDPAMPPTITNRDADNWRPLLAVADVAGDDWPVRARALAEAMTDKSEGDDQSLKTMLLEDIRSVFTTKGVDRLPSAELVEALLEMKDRPWPELGRAAKPITQNKLAALLKGYGIRPGNVWAGSTALKGYCLGQFEDAFGRYLSDSLIETARALERQEIERSPGEFKVLGDPRPSGSKFPATPTVSSHPSALAVQPAPPWESEV
jgi:putative DNA primase/helicase